MRPAFRLTLFAISLVNVIGTLAIGTSASAEGLIPQTTASRYGLTRAWYAQVGSPQATGRIEYLNYDEGMLLAQSSQGLLTAMNAETGRTLWNTQIGSRNGAPTEPAANDKFVVVLNGSTLYVIDRKDGGILWNKQVRGAPGAGPGVTATHAFVPMTTGLIEGFDLEAGVKQTPWNYQSTGRVLVPPMTTPLSVSWTTERGYFYVADPSAAGIKYRLESRGAIHSRPAAWSPMVYATSIDGLVYAINEIKGDIKWKFPVGEAIYKQPVALADRVFVVPELGGMYCLNAENGDLMWHVPGIQQFVSASPSRIYASDSLGRLAMLDAETGALVGTMPTSALSTKLVNSSSDRIFLFDDACVVQCLHETQLAAPAIHRQPAAVIEDLKLGPKRSPASPEDDPAEEMPAEDAPAEEPGADSDNPFAPPATDGPAAGDENPFGAPPEGGAAPVGEGDNPFATP